MIKKELKIILAIILFYFFLNILGQFFYDLVLIIKNITIFILIITLIYLTIKKNNLKLWIKGGLIGLLTLILFINLHSIISELLSYDYLFIYLSGFIGLYIIKKFFIEMTDPLKSIILFLPNLILYILIGSITGLIIEKIKKTKDNS